MSNDQKKAVAVFSPSIARALLRRGHHIVDIKQNRNDPIRTVFYFYMTKEFEADFESERAQALTRPELSERGIETAVVE